MARYAICSAASFRPWQRSTRSAWMDGAQTRIMACYYVLYKDVRCFQFILNTWIIVANKSRPTKTGNPQLHQHTCDTTVGLHAFVVGLTKESFETFCVTWFKYNVHKSLCIFIAQLVSFVFINRFRIQNFFKFKFAYRYLNLYCMASVLVLVLVLVGLLCCTWPISARL